VFHFGHEQAGGTYLERALITMEKALHNTEYALYLIDKGLPMYYGKSG